MSRAEGLAGKFKLTQQMERFVLLIWQGERITWAYWDGYRKGKKRPPSDSREAAVCAVEGSKLLRKPKIQEALAYLRRPVISKAVATMERRREILSQIAEGVGTNGAPDPSITAAERTRAAVELSKMEGSYGGDDQGAVDPAQENIKTLLGMLKGAQHQPKNEQ